ncbi:glycosyltransferase [Enterovirga rhinocerotis]|uniref:Glycosyl transferase family 2 n=1 Tax=Enterovirga rhinocerotis TaxID=1339210 RepID=A0A4R7BIY4_9HYPH|nr:glycosyltransferase [Enterovirga rhinocerotis]TDR85300.1 glycosyl transferase family 2 [Enterovirga rhinocerotis]
MSAGNAISRPTAVVAIPVCNEAERIQDCLMALASQIGIEAHSLAIVLFLNNCTDDTARIVASLLPVIDLQIVVIERNSEAANAGWARREAMEAAAALLDERGADAGILLTTDADSRVAPDWVARNLAAIACGADAVAGQIELDDQDAAVLPAALHARGHLESLYEALLIALEARIDPLAHDPWPRHWTTSGATLAVRLGAYRRVGGMPALALGEDRAFIALLVSNGAVVRHDPAVKVTTSGRLQGRAPGGAADTIRLRCEVRDSPCDPRLEALPRALFRFVWRRRLRRLHAERRLNRYLSWGPWLGLGRESAARIAALPTFGAVLAAVEEASLLLSYRPLRPAELPVNIRLARAAIARIRGASQRPFVLPSIAPAEGRRHLPAPAEPTQS